MPLSSTFKHEFRRLVIIAMPLVAAYLAEFAMFFTTKIVVGKLGFQSLAAVGISSHLSLEVTLVLMGLLTVVGVLCAQAEGAKDQKQAGLVVRQGGIVSIAIGIPATLVIWNMHYVLIWTHQDPEIIALSIPYLQGLSGFLIPVLLFSVLRSFVSAMSRPTVVMVITVMAVFVNYVFTFWFVYGGLGLPAMGLFGAGLSTSIVSWLMFFFLLGYVYRAPLMRGYGVFAKNLKIDMLLCREIFCLGLPVAGLVALEVGLFMAVSILAGVLGAETLAASEIVMSWIGIPFMVALGIAEATMVRVAYGVGERDLYSAQYSGFLGISLGILLLVVLVTIPIGFSDSVVQIFLSPDDPGYPAVSTIAIKLLVIAAVFQVFDGMQAIAARALRGIKDNIAPLWIAALGYWVFGIGGGALLAFYFDLKGVGLWLGLAAGLTTTGSLLVWRFQFKIKQMIAVRRHDSLL